MDFYRGKRKNKNKVRIKEKTIFLQKNKKLKI